VRAVEIDLTAAEREALEAPYRPRPVRGIEFRPVPSR
jgi:hypothetical protein